MNKVLSKYKTPDQFIKKLKAELNRAKRSKDTWRSDYYHERGNRVTNYNSNVEYEFNAISSSLESFRIGDEAVIVGTVTKTKARIGRSEIIIGNGVIINRRPKE